MAVVYQPTVVLDDDCDIIDLGAAMDPFFQRCPRRIPVVDALKRDKPLLRLDPRLFDPRARSPSRASSRASSRRTSFAPGSPLTPSTVSIFHGLSMDPEGGEIDQAPRKRRRVVGKRGPVPPEILCLVCDHLADDDDDASRAALANVMRTASYAYHAAARSLYCRIEIRAHNLERLFAGIRAETLGSDEGRWCEKHNARCQVPNASTPNCDRSPSTSPSPIGKLALFRYTQHLVVTGIPPSEEAARVVSQLGPRNDRHWAKGDSGMEVWDAARSQVFGRVKRVTISAQAYLDFQRHHLNPKYHKQPHPLVAMLAADVAPPTVCVQYPTMADVQSTSRTRRSESRDSRRRKYVCDVAPWLVELCAYWPIDEITLHDFAFHHFPSFTARRMRIYALQHNPASDTLPCTSTPQTTSTHIDLNDHDDHQSYNDLHDHNDNHVTTNDHGSSHGTSANTTTTICPDLDGVRNSGGMWHDCARMIRMLSSTRKVRELELANVGANFVLDCDCAEEYTEVIACYKEHIAADVGDAFVLSMPHHAEVSPCACCGRTARGSALQDHEIDPANFNRTCDKTHAWADDGVTGMIRQKRANSRSSSRSLSAPRF